MPKNKKGSSLKDAMKKGKEENEKRSKEIPVIVPGLAGDTPAPNYKGTGLVYDDSLKAHFCPHGSHHGKSENPERLSACYERLHEQGLLERCVRVTTRSVTDEEILSFHSKEYLETLKSIKSLSLPQLKELAESYDSIFLCNESFEVAGKSAGGVLNLVEQVVQGKLSNGFAVVRPPGHHAQHSCANGYSLLNNVGIAAKIAMEKWNVERVLIVDWDVHHGQGVQYAFEEDPRVMYFSIHQYENEGFWPHLKESNYDHIGKDLGRGFNINIPWNKTEMSDAEYLTTFQHVLLPLAYEFQPQLVLVCAGFDAATGDPKGEMNVSVNCFSHMARALMGLAKGKLVLSLEGGYNLDALGKAAAACTKTLLGDPCPNLPPFQNISDSALETLTNVTEAIKPYWKSLQCQITQCKSEDSEETSDVTSSSNKETSSPEQQPTRDTDADVDALSNRLQKELKLSKPAHRTGLVFDERMKLHRTFNHPERPERIARIYTKHRERGLLKRCHRIEARQATDEELFPCHQPNLVEEIKETSKHTARELIDTQDKYNTIKYSRDIYVHPDTYLSACVAAGCSLNLVDAVLTNQVLNAVGIIRPPGHHADGKSVSGFCFFNNAALATKYAQTKYGVKRILILDWDVHHGNGTQAIFEDDPSVLYISLHRYEMGLFYPDGPGGAADKVGEGEGKGYNVNIAWNTGNRGGVGDNEYIAAFHRIVMPLAHQFDPELVIISAGFDSAAGDPLGGCKVTPEGYGHMTHMLSSLAGGRLISLLEGGYNLHSIAVSMAMCTEVMLGDQCPDIVLGQPSKAGIQAIYEAAKAHQPYWASMNAQVKLIEAMICKDTSTKDDKESESPITENAEEEYWKSLEGDMSKELSSSTDAVGQMEIEHQGDRDNNKVVEATVYEELGESGLGDDELGACGGAAAAESEKKDSVLDTVSHLTEAFGPEVQLHAVIPMPWCPHLDGFVQPLPPEGLDVRIPCRTCEDPKENWVCLQCYEVHCGRYVNEHMLMHGLETGHLLVLSYSDLSVWCYGCDAYLHNEALIPAKRAAHLSKFGDYGGLPDTGRQLSAISEE